MLSLPHTPHALVVTNWRRIRAPGALTPGASVTSATLPSHILIWARSAAEAMTPSAARKPAVRSMSSPGVRMVTLSGSPPTLISSGSSTASRSARGPGPGPSGSVTRSTRRLAVLPVMPPPGAWGPRHEVT